MKRSLIVGLLAAACLPGLAAAQSYEGCARSNQNSTTEGTVLGAAGGALAGSALAGHHDRGLGAVLGAVGGGIIGNRIADARNNPCPQGYYRDPNYRPAYQPQPQPGYGYASGDQGYGPGWGHGHSVEERIQFMRDRLSDNQDDGQLSPYQARSAYRELSRIEHMAHRLTYRDGGELSPPDNDYLQSRLDSLRQQLRWERDRG